MNTIYNKIKIVSGLLLASFRLMFTIIWIPFQIVPTIILYPFFKDNVNWYRWFFWKVAGIAIGFKFIISGEFSKYRPLMVPINHTSLFDIICFAYAFNPNFISKADVANWPIFGLLARRAGTLFISRKRITAGRESSSLHEKIILMNKPVLFAPEGTTNDGTNILPFKSAMFETIIQNKDKIHVQPVVIKYTHINGKRTTEEQRKLISWIVGDNSSMLGKMFQVLRYRCWTCTIKILPEVDITKFNDRKTLTLYIENLVKREYAKL